MGYRSRDLLSAVSMAVGLDQGAVQKGPILERRKLLSPTDCFRAVAR